jgi:hypothetical protein
VFSVVQAITGKIVWTAVAPLLFVVGLLFAVTLLMRRLPDRPEGTVRGLSVVELLIAVLALAVVLGTVFSDARPFRWVEPQSTLEITFPLSREKIASVGAIPTGLKVDVEGTAKHLRDSDEIWLLLRHSDKPRARYYPQPGPVDRPSSRIWSGTAFLARVLPVVSEDDRVEISAVVATREGSQVIRDHLTKGFESLPEGVKSKARTEVRLRTRCIHPSIGRVSIRGSAHITTLSNGKRVERVVPDLLGVYGNLPRDTFVWILVYSDLAQRFYPQSHRGDAPADLLDGGRFRSSATFEGRVDEVYEVMTVFATTAASQFLSQTINRWTVTNDFGGLTLKDLPVGLDEKHCVPVALGAG